MFVHCFTGELPYENQHQECDIFTDSTPTTYEMTLLDLDKENGYLILQRSSKSEAKALDDLQTKLNLQYQEKRASLKALDRPEVGQLCVSVFEEDSQFYRGKIESIAKSDSSAQVFYIDFGNAAIVGLGKLYEISAGYSSERPFAVRVQINGLHDKNTWDDATAAAVIEWIHGTDMTFNVTVLKALESRSVGNVCHTLPDDSQLEKDLSRFLYNKKLLLRKDMITKKSSTASSSAKILSSPTKIAAKTSDQDPTPNKAANSKYVKQQPSTMLLIDIDIDEGLLVLQKGGEEAASLNRLQEKLNRHYRETAKSTTLASVAPGCLCTTVFNFDEKWYRAKVQAVNGDMVLINYIDFGNQDMVAKTDLFELAAEFRQEEAYSYKCRLSGVDKKPWSTDLAQAVAQWAETTDGKLVINEVKSTEDGTTSVNITWKGKSLTQHLVDSKLIKPAPVTDSSMDAVKAPPLVVDDSSRFADAEQEPTPKSAATKSQPAPDFTLINPAFRKGSLKMTLIDIDSANGFLILQSEGESLNLLNRIQAKLNKLYEDPTKKKQTLQSADVGDICAAKFADDGQWYRARVSAVDGSSATVQYIDFGNFAPVPKSELYQLTDFHSYPGFTVNCKLVGLDKWSEKANECIMNWIQSTNLAFDVTMKKEEADCIVADVTSDGKSIVKYLMREGFITRQLDMDTSAENKKLERATSDSAKLTKNISQSEVPSTRTLSAKRRNSSSRKESKKADQENAMSCQKSTVREPPSVKTSSKVPSKYVSSIMENAASKKDPEEHAPCKLNRPKTLSVIFQGEDSKCTAAKQPVVKKDATVASKFDEPLATTSDSTKDSVFKMQLIDIDAKDGILVLQMCDDKSQASLESLQHSINEFYNIKSNCKPLSRVVAGSLCVAKFNVDKKWYRAKIDQVVGPFVLVTYVDFGNVEKVAKANLLELHMRFKTFRPYSMNCKINGLHAAPAWSESVANSIMNWIQSSDMLFNITIVETKDNYTVVDMESKGLSLSKSLIKGGLITCDKMIKKTHIVSGQPPSTSNASVTKAPSNQPDSSSITKSEPQSKPIKQPVSTQQSNMAPQSKIPSPQPDSAKAKDAHPQPKPKEASTSLESKLTFQSVKMGLVDIGSDGSLVLQKMHQDKLELMQAEINKYYSDTSNMQQAKVVESGKFYACVFKDDGLWYRVQIVRVNLENPVVFFVDFGNCSVVSNKDICMLDKQFMTQPVYALKCKVNGLQNKAEWSAQVSDCVLTWLQDSDMTYAVDCLAYCLNGCAIVDIFTDGKKSLTTHLIEKKLVQPEDVIHCQEKSCAEKTPSAKATKGAIKQPSTPPRKDIKPRISPVRAPSPLKTCVNDDKNSKPILSPIKAPSPLRSNATGSSVDQPIGVEQRHTSEKGIKARRPLDKDSSFTNTTASADKDSIKTTLKQAELKTLANLNVKRNDLPSVKKCLLQNSSIAMSLADIDTDEGLLIMQRFGESNDSLEKMQDSLNKFYQSKQNLKPLTDVKIGDVCAAVFQEDSNWYRSKVTAINNDSCQATLSYIDFGNLAPVALKDLYCLASRFCSEPAFAIKCKLNGLHHVRWSEATSEAIIEWIQGTDMRFDVKTNDITGNHIVVDLLANEASLAEHLIMKNIIRKADMIGYPCEKELSNTTAVAMSYTAKPAMKTVQNTDLQKPASEIKTEAPKTAQQQPAAEKSTANGHSSTPSPHSFISKDIMKRTTSLNLVDINQAQGFLIFQRESAVLPDFQKKIQKYYSKPGNLKPFGDVQPGDICASIFSEDQQWYRIRICSINKTTSTAKVFYTDFGNYAEQHFKDCYKLPPPALSKPAFAFEIQPLGLGATLWDDKVYATVIQWIQQSENEKFDIKGERHVFQEAYDRLEFQDYIVAEISQNGSALSQFLIQESIIDAKSLETKQHITVNNNSPVKKQANPAPKKAVEETKVESKKEEVYSLNLHDMSVCIDDEIRDDLVKTITQSAPKTLPKESNAAAKLKELKPLTVTYTFNKVDPDIMKSIISCTVVDINMKRAAIILQRSDAESATKLDEMQKRMQEFYNVCANIPCKCEPIKTKDANKAGLLCAAVFSDDGQWYRAEVQKTEGSKTTVTFIDYGNSDVVPTTQLRTLANEFHCHPAFTITLKLDSVAPWSESVSKQVLHWFQNCSDGVLLKATSVQNGIVVGDLSCGRQDTLKQTLRKIVSQEKSEIAPKVGHKLKLASSPPTPATNAAETSSSDTSTLTTISPKLHQSVTIAISYCASVNEIYCQVVDQQLEALDQLMLSLNKHCVEASSETSTSLLPGAVCAAYYAHDDCWYRARVISVLPKENTACVQYVDYGNSSTVAVNSIKELPFKFRKLPAQCIRCELADAKQVGTEEADTNAAAIINGEAMKPLQAKFVHQIAKGNKYQIKVPVLFNQLLQNNCIQYGF